MEQNFQTSFIPKKPMLEERARNSRPTSFLTVLSIFIFFAVVVASGGLYFYKGMMTKNIASMDNSLTLAKSSFEPDQIARLQTLDKRLSAAETILSKHVAVSPIFKVLQDLTMKTVRYTKFTYALGDDGKVDVKMSGQAIGYRSVALQSDLYAKNKALIDPVFSNLSLDDKGNVLFDLEFSVDPTFVDYKQMLASQSSNSPDASQTGTGVVN